jgi:hypothetical protein
MLSGSEMNYPQLYMYMVFAEIGWINIYII